MKKIILFMLLAHLPVANADVITLSAAQLKNLQVQLVTPSQSASAVKSRYTGEVTIPSTQERIVSAPQQGLIDALNAATGQSVKKGQVLGHLSSPGLISMQSDYLQTLTKKRLSEKAVARDNSLYQDGIIPQRRQQETQSHHEELSAMLAEKRQALRLAGMSDASISMLNSSKGMSGGMSIVAPIDGQVVEQMVNVGQRVESATAIYKIAKLNPLWLEINVPIDDASIIKPGMLVTIPSQNAEGKVIALLRQVNKPSQTLQIRAEITQGAEELAAGQFVEAEISLNRATQSYTLPRKALVRHGKQTVVFKRTKVGYETVAVDVLSEQDISMIVTGNLQGEKIATSNIAALKGLWLGMGGE